MKYNIGFDNRIFLEEYEWITFLKRKPVRFIRKTHDICCRICGNIGQLNNKLQHAHIIGFHTGIIELGLTPDYLDRHDNIISAHIKICNKKAELSKEDSMKLLISKGIYRLPEYLPDNTKELFTSLL